MSLEPSFPPAAPLVVADPFDARWAAWQTKAAAQDKRWHGYATIAAILLGCGLVAAMAGVIYVG